MKKIVTILALLPFLATAQNVGIGKTNPQAKLEIKQTSNLEPTLMLSDSTGNFAGRLQFRSLFSQYANRGWFTDYKVGTYSKDNEIFLYNDSINVMNIYGTGNITIGDGVTPNARLSVLSDNPSSDILNVMGSSSQSALKILGNRNVGIKNPTPAEALDVTGNINVTGTIKANGIDGTANQVLMKNGSGILSWGTPYPASDSDSSVIFLAQTTRNIWVNDPNISISVPETGKYLVFFYGSLFNNNEPFSSQASYDSDAQIRVYNLTTDNEIFSKSALSLYFDHYTSNESIRKYYSLRPSGTITANLSANDVLKLQYRQLAFGSPLPTGSWFIANGGISILKIGN